MIRRIQIIECIAIILVILGVIEFSPINLLTHPILPIALIFLGILLFIAKRINKRTQQTDLEQLAYYTNQVNQLNQRVTFIEKNDIKTLLPNYEQFKEMGLQHIENAQQHHEQFCIIFIDVDQFENVNEQFGRSIGDSILMQLSERLNELFRQPNFVARINDDEFAIIIAGVKSTYYVDKIARRITRLLNIPYHIEDHEIYSSVTAGIACFPQDGMTFDDLISGAKTALSNAKKECKGNYRFLTKDLHEQHSRFVQLESALRMAIEHNDFELHYQPQFLLHNKDFIGFECLIRWNDTVLGMISPVEFIPLAEHIGLLHKITDWVISTGLTQMNRWHTMGLSEFQLAFNLSADKFQNPRFLPTLLEHISELKISPKHIEFEITEMVVNKLIESGKNNIHDIAKSGIKIAIDDFGTGYSSLSRLTTLPISTLKIDKSFVSNLDKNNGDKKIIEAIIQLGKNLNMDVLAEGIETEAQLQFLIKRQCKFGQGYLYSKPLNMDNATQFLKKAGRKSEGSV